MHFTNVALSLLALPCAIHAEYNIRGSLPQTRNLQRRGTTPLRGWWGTFSHFSAGCLEKTTTNCLEMLPCDDTVPGQMWKFDKEKPIQDYQFGGLLYNMNGGCMSYDSSDQSVSVKDCNRNDPNQHWLSDGDSLRPRDNREICVNPLPGGMGFENCYEADSMDY